ncbi:hypothetical protein DYB26_004658 [Aphanomyces astaci]|uniref:BTB domain-containing protein n=1 Tax=Aphanomyces astaci TaxID=112090 RepID=A0A3R7A490_APHAT|nr:hypothetical protein DYB26_004658 [Aphanomyces astaci]
MKAKRATDEPDSLHTSLSMDHLSHACPVPSSMATSSTFLAPSSSTMMHLSQAQPVIQASPNVVAASSALDIKSTKTFPIDKKRKLPSPVNAVKPPSKKLKQTATPTKTPPSAQPSAASVGVPSLCEYPEWSRRRSTCNLVVVVEGTQFNLHKFPMLIACPELRTKLPSLSESSASSVTLLKYAHFPGGAAAFELACIYAYTGGSVVINASNVALLYCAARVLKMHVGLTSRCATLLETLAHTGSGDDAVHMLLQVVEIRKCLRNQSTDRMMALCVHAIASRYPYDASTMSLIVKLPFDVFLHITQLVLNDRPHHDATANNVVARLCAQAHLAQVFRSAKSADKAAELIRVLDVLLSSDTAVTMQQQFPSTHQLLDDDEGEEEEGEVVEDDLDGTLMLNIPHVKMENEWLAAAQFIAATAQ